MNNLAMVTSAKERSRTPWVPWRAHAALARSSHVPEQPRYRAERTGHITAAAQAYQAAITADSTYSKASASLARLQQLTEDREHPPVISMRWWGSCAVDSAVEDGIRVLG